MKILFLKGARTPVRDDSDEEPLPDKMRRLLQSHVEEAKTDDDKERALNELRKLEAMAGKGMPGDQASS